jgi:carbon storage regulator
MLLLTRRAGEAIVATLEDGRTIEFRIVGIRACQVKVGVEAPKTVVIDREEIHERKLRERQEQDDNE